MARHGTVPAMRLIRCAYDNKASTGRDFISGISVLNIVTLSTRTTIRARAHVKQQVENEVKIGI